jgi:hypothetical protein
MSTGNSTNWLGTKPQTRPDATNRHAAIRKPASHLWTTRATPGCFIAAREVRAAVADHERGFVHLLAEDHHQVAGPLGDPFPVGRRVTPRMRMRLLACPVTPRTQGFRHPQG